MKRKIFIIFIIILLILILFFVIRKIKNGNNISNKSADEIIEYILNIQSYEADVTINITTNKTNNTYKAKQQYLKNEKIYKQKITDDKYLDEMTICYNNETLTITNSKIEPAIIYNKYGELVQNNLSLESFINDYNSNKNSTIEENNEYIILYVPKDDKNDVKSLYINKSTNKISKMIIENGTQKSTTYIEYNEIKINSLQKEDILAFN